MQFSQSPEKNLQIACSDTQIDTEYIEPIYQNPAEEKLYTNLKTIMLNNLTKRIIDPQSNTDKEQEKFLKQMIQCIQKVEIPDYSMAQKQKKLVQKIKENLISFYTTLTPEVATQIASKCAKFIIDNLNTIKNQNSECKNQNCQEIVDRLLHNSQENLEKFILNSVKFGMLYFDAEFKLSEKNGGLFQYLISAGGTGEDAMTFLTFCAENDIDLIYRYSTNTNQVKNMLKYVSKESQSFIRHIQQINTNHSIQFPEKQNQTTFEETTTNISQSKIFSTPQTTGNLITDNIQPRLEDPKKQTALPASATEEKRSQDKEQNFIPPVPTYSQPNVKKSEQFPSTLPQPWTKSDAPKFPASATEEKRSQDKEQNFIPPVPTYSQPNVKKSEQFPSTLPQPWTKSYAPQFPASATEEKRSQDKEQNFIPPVPTYSQPNVNKQEPIRSPLPQPGTESYAPQFSAFKTEEKRSQDKEQKSLPPAKTSDKTINEKKDEIKLSQLKIDHFNSCDRALHTLSNLIDRHSFLVNSTLQDINNKSTIWGDMGYLIQFPGSDSSSSEEFKSFLGVVGIDYKTNSFLTGGAISYFRMNYNNLRKLKTEKDLLNYASHNVALSAQCQYKIYKNFYIKYNLIASHSWITSQDILSPEKTNLDKKTNTIPPKNYTSWNFGDRISFFNIFPTVQKPLFNNNIILLAGLEGLIVSPLIQGASKKDLYKTDEWQYKPSLFGGLGLEQKFILAANTISIYTSQGISLNYAFNHSKDPQEKYLEDFKSFITNRKFVKDPLNLDFKLEFGGNFLNKITSKLSLGIGNISFGDSKQTWEGEFELAFIF